MITDKEGIDRKTEDYTALAQAGLFPGEFSGSYQMPPSLWQMEFQMLREMSPEAAKRAAVEFLTSQYEASDIKFWRVPSSQSKFMATFYRGDFN